MSKIDSSRQSNMLKEMTLPSDRPLTHRGGEMSVVIALDEERSGLCADGAARPSPPWRRL